MARRALTALLLLFPASLSTIAAAEAPHLSKLAALVHSELQDQRVAAGRASVEREAALDRAALVIAREVAARKEKDRLRGRLRALERASEAGATELAWAEARVFLMRGSREPVDEVVRQWSIASESWARFLEEDALRYGVGATRSNEGWLIVVALVGKTRTENASARRGPPSTEHLRSLEARARSLVLAERRRRGLPPLVRDSELDRLARLHSLDMAQRGVLSHEGSDNRDVAQRLERERILFKRVSENVALVNSEDPAQSAVRGWMESPGHRSNILDGAMTRTGIGVAWNPDGSFFFTQVFMRPPRGR